MIEAQNLTRRFGGFTAVDDVSFSVERGEVVGFLGPNGAGKTTTMRMLTGYLPPTSGTVKVDGLDVGRDSLEVRRRIGYLPESVPLYAEHKVEEMLAFQGRLFGLSKARIQERTEEILARVGLSERRGSLIGSLSKGMRQRVGLAVAILPDPEVLILDEPTSGLDPLQRLEVRDLVREVARERTVLLSSHILPEVEAIADRVVILNRGRIAADGTGAELVAQLGGGASVRLEAVLGDAAEAARLLGTLPGVRAVNDTGRLGIHQGFDVVCDEDLREDVGALAAAKGWALRELSFQRPSLEQLFARIALDLDEPGQAPAPADVSAPVAAPEPTTASGGLGLLPLSASQAPLEVPGAPAADAESAPAAAPTATPAAPPGRASASKPLPPGTKAPSRPVYNLNPFELGAQNAPRDLAKPNDPDACESGDKPNGGASSAE